MEGLGEFGDKSFANGDDVFGGELFFEVLVGDGEGVVVLVDVFECGGLDKWIKGVD